MELPFASSAFFLPDYLIDFLNNWESEKLDLLDAYGCPLVVTGRAGSSIHQYVAKEIAKEKSQLKSANGVNGIEELLSHKSGHFWSRMARGKARMFGEERFHLFPEIQHLSFMHPMNMWPLPLKLHFFSKYKPNQDGNPYRFDYQQQL
jgi:hypothetical protein